MALEKLRSIFEEELKQRVEDFISDSSDGTQFTSPLKSKLNDIADIYVDNRPGAFDTNFFNTPPQPTIHIATNPTDFSTAVGNNDSAFTPLGQLGKSPLEGKSWENLYNDDHSPKDGVGYGYPNVNRDKLNIRDNGTNASIYNLSRTELLGLGAGEPYIVSKISKGTSDSSGGRLINQGPIAGIPVNRMITDTLRIGKYLTSPAGIAFIAKQNFLGANSKSVFISKNGELLQSRQRFKQTYNPLSTLIQTGLRAGGVPVTLTDKTEPGLSSFFGSDEYPTLGGNVKHNINDTFNEGEDDNVFGFKKFKNKLLSTVKGLTGLPTEAEKAFTGKGDKHTLIEFGKFTNIDGIKRYINKIEDAHPEASKDETIEGEKNGMPFYFKDMRDGAFIFFRAYLEGLSENISPSWTPTSYMGRSDNVYTYERAEREIQFTLKLVAQTKDELKMIYKKMNKLTSLCYPEYVNEGEDGYGNRMKPPLTKLRMGELFGNSGNNELMGFIKSLAYSIEQTSPWETEVGKRVPRHINVSIGYQVIHASVPNLETKFYGYIGAK